MQDIYYIDESFVKENSSEYSLSIRLATDGLSFCIHSDDNRLLAFVLHPLATEDRAGGLSALKPLMTGEDLFRLPYRQVQLQYCKKEKILLPEDFSGPSVLADFYRQSYPDCPGETLVCNRLEGTGTCMVSGLDSDLLSRLESGFGSFTAANSAWAFIKGSLSDIELNVPHLFMEIQRDYFDLLITDSRRIRLFNTFSYTDVDDILYFTLNALEQCGTDREQLLSVISGHLTDEPETAAALRQFIPQVQMAGCNPLAHVLKAEGFNHSCFINLLNMHKCG